ncbi:MAG: hypothetical protein ACHQ1H_12240 [Nitrososphaerales archaeon]
MRQIGTLFGRPIAQYWEDLELWERVLNDYPDMKWIVELGTWEGGMSFYLYGQAYARKMFFSTIDIKDPEKLVPLFVNYNVHDGFPKHITYPIKYPGILFCDNGDKPEEVKMYSQIVNPESIIAVHDWGTEFIPNDIPNDWHAVRSSSTTVFLAKNDSTVKMKGPVFTP